MSSRFELRCHQCNVSFPPDARRCMYCGGRLGTAEDAPSIVQTTELPAAELPEEELDPEGGSRSTLRILTSLLWVGLALLASLYRVCTEGS
jgi:hypothetical protein